MPYSFRLVPVLAVALVMVVSCNGGSSDNGAVTPTSLSSVSSGTTTSEITASEVTTIETPAPVTSSILGSQDQQILSQYMNDTATGDIMNTSAGAQIGLGLDGSFGFPLMGLMMTPNANCVSISGAPSKGAVTSSDTDVTVTFTCPGIVGTLEMTFSSSSTGSSFELSENVTVSNASGESRAMDDTISISKTTATGVVVLEKTIDDNVVVGSTSYEIEGDLIDTLTPTEAARSFQGGMVQISATLNVTKNGDTLGTFNIASDALEYSTCGLSGGSIDFENGSNSCELSYLGCGNPSYSCSGPSPTPSAKPSPEPSLAPSPSPSVKPSTVPRPFPSLLPL
jgi:hypothetical protein